MNYLAVFILINFLILVHELGHLFAAKLANIPIERFSIGFGPRLLTFKRGETEYCLSALPFIGAYVAMAGMEEEAFDARFRGSAVRRARYEGFLRSVAIAMGNEGNPAHRERLEELARHASALVRDHARWALGRLEEG